MRKKVALNFCFQKLNEKALRFNNNNELQKA